jgi:hypothetical protein
MTGHVCIHITSHLDEIKCQKEKMQGLTIEVWISYNAKGLTKQPKFRKKKNNKKNAHLTT